MEEGKKRDEEVSNEEGGLGCLWSFLWGKSVDVGAGR